MPRLATVLMYHAVSSSSLDLTTAADPHYSVSIATFERQLDLIAQRCGQALDIQRLALASDSCTGITFDDGHASNYEAAQRLANRSWTADFFVNPSTIGSSHYLTWGQLRDMADWGMSIQSHGQTHRFMDELSTQEIQQELLLSKSEIEQQLGRPVRVFAPPGGRMRKEVPRIARDLGYTHICTSNAGAWAIDSSDSMNIPRLAILQSTGEQQFQAWITQSKQELWKQILRHKILYAAKKALGNKLYVALREKYINPQP